ncbi:hypothetical protein FJZ33_04285 [Candidatus Poribacteria bacterium]|nr:hypothetical protein [Candidatus Poribacteria bacterium]
MLLILSSCFLLYSISSIVADVEEFVGPFPSWKDLKRDYGAVGDGKADDTAALQKGLNDLVGHENACVLYIPAGEYRLTDTVKTIRKAHTDCQGVSIIGEDPASTILKWDGPEDGVMFQWDAWYSKISRLTFDGIGKAGVALIYGPAFSTYNETSYIIFRDVKSGLVFGGPDTNGQAENEVSGCHFLRCGTGIQTVNWNSMDIWVWYSKFEDCDKGIYNVMGNWHAWKNIFLRSRICDMGSINLMVFSVVDNVSVGSRCFFDFSSGHSWGSPVSLTGNRILDPTGEWAVVLDNAGPYLLVDNMFRLSDQARAVRMTWGNQTLVGNMYTKDNAVEERGHFRRIDERVVSHQEIPDNIPELIPVPISHNRKVFEVPAGADSSVIQQAINEAAKLKSQRPIVHLPVGKYPISETLIIPKGCDLQIVGDGGGETATRLEWFGPKGGILLKVEGPSHVVLRDFYIHGTDSKGLLIENADQEGGHIFADQLNVNGPSKLEDKPTAALRVNGIVKTHILLRALQGNGNNGRWVEVFGNSNPETIKNQVSIFTGATGSAKGQYNIINEGKLVVRGVYHERSSDSLTGLHLSDSGTLSIDATRFSYATSEESPTFLIDNFRGLFTLATGLLMPVETQETCSFEFRGDGSSASVLALNNQFWVNKPGTSAKTVWINKANPPVRGGLIGCNINTGNKEAAPKGFDFLENLGDHRDPARSRYGSGPLDDQLGVDDDTILRHLVPIRQARIWLPGERQLQPESTDIRIYRLMISGGYETAAEFK